MTDKPIGKDATGYEILTDAMKALLNQYPGLYQGESIKFEELNKDSGIAFSADNGALIYSEKEDVCGVMHQVCQYPFYVVYRTASDKERQKLSVQKFLDNLSKWICRDVQKTNDLLLKTALPLLMGVRTDEGIPILYAGFQG
jgi:hypothetical protein